MRTLDISVAQLITLVSSANAGRICRCGFSVPENGIINIIITIIMTFALIKYAIKGKRSAKNQQGGFLFFFPSCRYFVMEGCEDFHINRRSEMP